MRLKSPPTTAAFTPRKARRTGGTARNRCQNGNTPNNNIGAQPHDQR